MKNERQSFFIEKTDLKPLKNPMKQSGQKSIKTLKYRRLKEKAASEKVAFLV